MNLGLKRAWRYVYIFLPKPTFMGTNQSRLNLFADINKSIVYIFGVFLTIITLYYAHSFFVNRVKFGAIFLGVGMSLFYLHEGYKILDVKNESPWIEDDVRTQVPTQEENSLDTSPHSLSKFEIANYITCLGAATATIGVSIYVVKNFERLLFTVPVVGPNQVEIYLGILIITLVIDATRRAYGNLVAGAILVMWGYGIAGPWLPGFWSHPGMSVTQIAQNGAMGLSGVYGFILQVGSTWVAIFIMLAGLAKTYGLMDYILNVSEELSHSLRTGVANITIIGSMLMGSITGSAVANTATTGSFTIPMLKKQGVKPTIAAAFESVASSGGQIMPPVMGVAAFLMADILRIPFVNVIQAALVPALLFYFSIIIPVNLIVLKNGWTTEQTEGVDYGIIKQGWYYVIPLIVLLYTLVIQQLTPLSAGYYSVFSLVGVVAIVRIFAHGIAVKSIKEFIKSTSNGFCQGAIDMAPLVAVLGSIGFAVTILSQTGITFKISFQMINIAGGSLIILLILAMIVSIIFGMGMPTPAAYILVVVLVAPGLNEVGIPSISAHMFVFYFAVLSAITPPIALAVAVAARIANCDFLTACYQSLRVALLVYVIPFIFIHHSSLIHWEIKTPVILTFVTIGIYSAYTGLIGHNGWHDLTKLERTGNLILGALLTITPMVLSVITLFIFIAINGRNIIGNQKAFKFMP